MSSRNFAFATVYSSTIARELIDLSYDHTATYLYDRFQKASNGIEF